MSDSTANEINRDFAEAKKLITSQSYAEAEQILLKIVSKAPTHVSAWQELGNIRYRSKAFSKAIEAFQRRYGLEPNDPVVNYSLGITLIELGRTDEARGFLKRALEIKPDFSQAKQRLDKLEMASQAQNRPPTPQTVDTMQLPDASAFGTSQSDSFNKQSRTANIQGARDSSSRPIPKWSWYSTNPYAPEPPLLFKIIWWTMILGGGFVLISGLISYMS